MRRPAWEREGRGWPNREASAFVTASGLRWHVQRMGRGPVLLLLHGTGAATHSWRDVMPLLARDFTVIAPDLPGHGFTDPLPSHRLSLPGMARAVAGLLDTLQLSPDLAAGHSAGAAVLVRMALDRLIEPRAIVSFNGAFLPFKGAAGHLFAPLARLLVLNPLAPRLFSWRADAKAIDRLIRNTGSVPDRAALEFYGRLIRCPGHVSSVLRMMANWDLPPLARDLRRLGPKLILAAAAGDLAIPFEQTERLRGLLPSAIVEPLGRLGHLAHEERPDLAADLIARHSS
ncbi:alpha/beta fold hydrolase BchO [Skermanella stibiiresistens]|uniref:alpha/beta fold hydrolase BchO n=1 Tax=Skermanella stibiiresistens TaxID=913326 RepID=UPI0004B7642C|nr:alpha/beta fold hydrolase BchO [Skermanella stibiiresistens]